MPVHHHDLAVHQELVQVVRSVRNRWRARLLLRGAAVLLLLAAVAVVLAGYVIDLSRFDATTVNTVRLLVYLAFLVALARWVVWPLARRISDERIALYLEEHEPSLNGRLISALELGRQSQEESAGAGMSPVLMDRLVQSAMEACQEVEGGRRIERAGLWRSSGLMAGSTACCLGVLLLGPAFLSHTTPVLLDPWLKAEASSPYGIAVEPGDTTLAKGSDLKVTARLENFDAAEVELAVRAGTGDWTRWSMLSEEESHTLMVFDLREATEYFVEASGVRSATHKVEVLELPYVDEIHLTYHFPAYTGLDPVQQPGSGDIAALVGTEVLVDVTPTFAVPGGFLEVGDGELVDGKNEGGVRSSLEVTDQGRLRGKIRVTEQAVYRILLESAQGPVVASPDFIIDPLADQPPLVVVTKPGRDTKASSLEEVSLELKALDDYGVARLDLVFSVGGGDEQTANLYRRKPGRKEFIGAETLYLEEYDLRPGDLISYYARARDGLGAESVSDIYFLEIRPFDRNYRQADQGGMPGEGGAGGEELSSQQRLIVSAAFKLAHRKSRADDDSPADDPAFAGDITTVAMSQGRLRQQVAEMVQRMSGEGIVDQDSPAAVIAEALPLAIAEMELAEQDFGEHDPKAALSPAQKALQYLQRVEAAVRDIQVARGQEGGGGGGGEINEELADLFEMEADRLKNQYEQVQRGAQQSADDAIDETLEKLRELARRQQQENERMRARAKQAAGGTRTGSSGRTQRQLAEEAEEAARQLERLAREEKLPDLAETARQLRQAAEEMRRAAASGERTSEALGNSALDQLRQARRQLEDNKSGRLERDTKQALERTQRLRDEQERMIDRVGELSPEDPGYDEAMGQLLETKERMGAEVGSLEGALDQLSRDFQRDQAEASRRLREAVREIRDGKIREKILYSRGVVQQRSRDYARNFEENIAAELGQLEQRLRDAEGAIGESGEQRLGRALEETREVVQALESLGERVRDAGEPGSKPDPNGAPRGGGAVGRPDQDRGLQRQFGRELGERRGQLERLRQRLSEEGVEADDLARIIDRIRGLESGGPLGDKTLAVLEQEIVQGLKEFEYGLRRSLSSGDRDRLLAAEDGEVPEGYEEMVEQYYKALAGGDSQ